jgi:hypothetical protein
MDPLEKLTHDEQLDLRLALTVAIDKHGKMPEDESELELVNRWQNLAERLDEYSDLEQGGNTMDPMDRTTNEYILRISVPDDEPAVATHDIKMALYRGIEAIDTEDAISVDRLS